MKKEYLFILLFALLGVLNSKSIAQTTFTSTQSGDWNKGATWGNAGNVQGTDWPAGTDNAVVAFGTTVLLRGNVNINDFTIDGAGVLDDNNKQLTINGNFLLNGTKTGKKKTVFT